MKVVLFGLNGSYSHTCLAIRCLRAPLEAAGYETVICEYNLRDMNAVILSRLVGERAEVYSFSCYIWNIASMLDIAADLKALLPESKIIFGGPEVSFACERFDFDFIDYIVRGEGEDAIVKICAAIKSGDKIDRIIDGGRPDVMRDEGILYREGDFDSGTMLYYESSRGCPYKCAYCLSSASEGVRAKSVEQTLCDLRAFETLDSKIKIIKFVDRTFNFNIKRANEIWRALLSDEFTKNYHFEVCANLLNEESFEIFEKMPKGKIQLEIGLQSTNLETLDVISRHLDAQKIITAAARVKALGNIHVHLDLIAGLPYEDMQSFRKSFDEAYHSCDMLQLGFLKLLYGTELRKNAEKYGYVASKKAPYTVLKSNWMSFEDLSLLQEIADILDRYREGGGFEQSLEYALENLASPFDFYLGLRNFIAELDGRSIRKISQNDAYALLYQYIALNYPEKEEEFSRLLHEDYAKKQVRKPPRFKR
ncbi:MAG: DUF4080 domain-containing protein [Clostridia bacterium]|nr:DUF4080 domain-containing protein [Clostridia bacterium]